MKNTLRHLPLPAMKTSLAVGIFGLALSSAMPVMSAAIGDCPSPCVAANMSITKNTTLTSNISGSITILGNGVTLNGNGFGLYGNSSSDGVSVIYVANVTIENIDIEGFDIGINAYHSDGIHLDHIDVYDSSIGILVDSSDHSVVESIYASGNSSIGVAIWGSDDATIEYVTARGNDGMGVEVYLSHNAYLNRVYGYNNDDEGIAFQYNQNLNANRLLARDNGSYGIALYSVDGATITSSALQCNEKSWSSPRSYSCGNDLLVDNTSDGNTIDINSGAIVVNNGSGNTIY
ncbi:MAG: hypothetical protein COA42_16710 [Alteromonadaceae bacterium]|nr:MAG: hypothetical protein COA42_16710 [Alteromonadaceae bacterium]